MLGLLCCSDFFLVGVSRGSSPVVVYGFLIAVASLLWSTGSRAFRLQKLQVPGSRAQARQWWRTGLNRPEACGTFPDQGADSCLLHWLVDTGPPGEPLILNYEGKTCTAKTQRPWGQTAIHLNHGSIPLAL